MNIFKILANGDGTLKEANISAFIGYLLDPYENHGLGYEFLKRFLMLIDVDSKFYDYDYELEFEQAFKEQDGRKQIVDIVIACFPNQRRKSKESITFDSVQNERKLEKIYLIENKITSNAKKAEQLNKQSRSTELTLKIIPDNIFSIYLTPDVPTYHSEYENSPLNNKNHILWKHNDSSNESRKNSVLNLLQEIILDESQGKIEAINEYTRHTIISFIKFIENDFKSGIQEKQENSEKYKKDIKKNIEEYFSAYRHNLNENSNNLLSEFNKYLGDSFTDLSVRYTKTHPISVFKDSDNKIGTKIFSCSSYGKGLIFNFVIRKENESKSTEELYDFLKKNNNHLVDKTEYGIELKGISKFAELKETFDFYMSLIK